ncbi:MAG: hypothetical protein ACRD1T_18565, partial [Acidimicrobiia bacterium]
MDACSIPDFCFDSRKYAGFLSQMSGVLSGIAFLAICVLLQGSLTSGTKERAVGLRRELGPALQTMVSAFISLLVSTFL